MGTFEQAYVREMIAARERSPYRCRLCHIKITPTEREVFDGHCSPNCQRCRAYAPSGPKVYREEGDMLAYTVEESRSVSGIEGGVEGLGSWSRRGAFARLDDAELAAERWADPGDRSTRIVYPSERVHRRYWRGPEGVLWMWQIGGDPVVLHDANDPADPRNVLAAAARQ